MKFQKKKKLGGRGDWVGGGGSGLGGGVVRKGVNEELKFLGKFTKKNQGGGVGLGGGGVLVGGSGWM